KEDNHSSPPEAPNRLQKAKNTLQSGKKFLGEAKNLKTSIKTGTTTALEGLFQSVKEAENERRRMEEVVKEKEERLAQYERIGIRKEGEESEKERKEKHEEKEEIVKELKNRMEEWREKYMEKERKLREIEKEIEEFGMTCVECENKAVQMQRMFSDNYELRELQYAEVDEKIRQLMDARSKTVKCGHCGGPHRQGECEQKQAGTTPKCVNCEAAKTGDNAHNAFSTCCPIRRKWDSIARARVAYE
ncbi:hypothetical protein ACJJTC_018008, partial [Scirpophaga incertulas]